MASAVLTLGMAGFSIWANSAATKDANRAAKKEFEARKALSERRQQNERNAMKENSEKMLRNRDRRLSELRVFQAARGFAESGTPLLVFGDVKSRLDDEIDMMREQGLDRVAQYREQTQMDKFGMEMGIAKRNSDLKYNNIATLVGGIAKAGGQAYDHYRNTGNMNPFSIF